MRSPRLQNLFGQLSAPSQRFRKRTKPQSRPQAETMEGRTLLSAIVSGPTLQVTENLSSTNTNSITVENGTFPYALTVQEIPGGTYNFTALQLSGVKGINITETTFNYNDTVNVENDLNLPVTIHDGSGTDAVCISQVGQNLNNIGGILGYVAVYGGAKNGANDTLNVYDQQDLSGSPSYTMTQGKMPVTLTPCWSVDRPGAACIYYTQVNTVTVNGSDLTATYDVQASEPNGTTDIIAASTGNAPATVNVGQNHSVSTILGTLSISNPGNMNAIDVDDSGDTHPCSVGLWTGGTNSNLGQIQIVRLAPLGIININYTYADTSSVTVQGGTAGNTWYVEATGANGLPTGVITNLVDGGAAGGLKGGPGTFYVGSNNSVSSIQGTLNITNPTDFNDITLENSADTGPHAIYLSTLSPNPTAWNRPVAFGSITGLAPVPINYAYDDTSSLTVQGGDCPLGNTWDVQDTGFNYGSTGVVTTNIVAGGPDTVNVGNSVNGVQSIQGTLNISDSNPNSPFLSKINIIDSADTISRTATLSTLATSPGSPTEPWGQITGLAPAQINYEYSTTSTPVNISTLAGPSDALLGPVLWSVSANAMASVSVPVVDDNGFPINVVPTQPTLNAGYGLTYSPPANTIPLFNNGLPSYWDVRQGAKLGDCWLLASLAEVAAQDPRGIENMFTYDGTIWDTESNVASNVALYTVRFFNSTGSPEYVQVDTELPNGGVYYDDQVTTSLSPQTQALWVALAEKAYAVANGAGYVTTSNENVDSYDALSGGFPSWRCKPSPARPRPSPTRSKRAPSLPTGPRATSSC